jgi:PAS domain S-box-containing protein
MTQATTAILRWVGALAAATVVWQLAVRGAAEAEAAAAPALRMALDVGYVVAVAALLIVALRRSQAQRSAVERRLQSLVDQPLVGVYLIEGGRFRLVNRKFADILGYGPGELMARVPVESVIHEDDREVVLERMRARLEGARDSVNHTFRAVRKDGRAVPVEVWGRGTEWRGRPAIAGVLVDHSSRQILASQLRRSQKLESIGEFTGAVAHDFNNLLTAVIAPLQLILADMDDTDPLRGQLQEVETAAGRGAALSRQLLAFSRKQVVRPSPHDLNQIVRRVESMLERLVGAAIELETDLAPDVHTILADPSQVEQVLMNLVVNARDAMPDGGTLTIATANVDQTEDPVRSDGEDPPLGFVRLTVTDTGHGFDESVRAKIFDPYFTTKEDGTGLGLSTVFGIASQAGGFVRVTSSPGEGATFRVYLPAVELMAEQVAVSKTPPADLEGGSETILLVEDQDPVRQAVVRALKRFGYTVVETSSGEEAIEMMSKGLRPDLLLTDVMLPGRSGPDVVKRLSEQQPDLKVLFISGHADEDVFEEAGGGRRWRFLPKPFSVEDLLESVRSALEASTGT